MALTGLNIRAGEALRQLFRKAGKTRLELALTSKKGGRPLWQARLVATAEGCVVLPGAIFHPVDALSPIENTLRVAKERSLERDEVLDALLRMEHAFRTLTRVKLAYAYRPAALPT